MNKIKSLKVTWNGKPLREIYAHATKWQVFKYRVRRFFFQLFKWSLVGSVVAGAIYGSFQMGARATDTYEVTVDNLPGKIEELKNEVVRKLSDNCELPNKNVLPYTIDSNGKGGKQVVFGDFQYVPKTVQHYMKTLYGKDITVDEAIILALDEERAAELTKDIIFKTKNWSLEWQTCANRLGLVKDVEFIKKLEK